MASGGQWRATSPAVARAFSQWMGYWPNASVLLIPPKIVLDRKKHPENRHRWHDLQILTHKESTGQELAQMMVADFARSRDELGSWEFVKEKRFWFISLPLKTCHNFFWKQVRGKYCQQFESGCQKRHWGWKRSSWPKTLQNHHQPGARGPLAA